MGGGPDAESLLITLPFPKDDAQLSKIPTEFPHIKEINYFQINKAADASPEVKEQLKG
jgi:hypothetical protein